MKKSLGRSENEVVSEENEEVSRKKMKKSPGRSENEEVSKENEEVSRKKTKKSPENEVVSIFGRELISNPRSFTNKLGNSEVRVRALERCVTLEGSSFATSVCYNNTGNLIVSGSVGPEVTIWNRMKKNKNLEFNSGHNRSISQARFVPLTDDKVIVTCANDCQIRHVQIVEGGNVRIRTVGTLEDPVTKLAMEPTSPFLFYSGGFDGVVRHFDLRTSTPRELFICPILSHNEQVVFNRISSLVIDPRDNQYIAVGGTVDQFARVFDIRFSPRGPSTRFGSPVDMFCPRHIIEGKGRYHGLHINGLAYSCRSELLVSYAGGVMYLFDKDMGCGSHSSFERVGIPQSSECPQEYKGHRSYKGSTKPRDICFFGSENEYIISGSDFGSIFFWRKVGGKIVQKLYGGFYDVSYIDTHPLYPYLVSSETGGYVRLWTPTAEYPASREQSSDGDTSLPSPPPALSWTGVYSGSSASNSDNDNTANSDARPG